MAGLTYFTARNALAIYDPEMARYYMLRWPLGASVLGISIRRKKKVTIFHTIDTSAAAISQRRGECINDKPVSQCCCGASLLWFGGF